VATDRIRPAASPQVDVIVEASRRWPLVRAGARDGSETEWGKVAANGSRPGGAWCLPGQLDGSWKYNPACITEVEINFTALGALGKRGSISNTVISSGWAANAGRPFRELLNSGWGLNPRPVCQPGRLGPIGKKRPAGRFFGQ